MAALVPEIPRVGVELAESRLLKQAVEVGGDRPHVPRFAEETKQIQMEGCEFGGVPLQNSSGPLVDIGAAVFQPPQEAVLGFRIAYGLPGAFRHLHGQSAKAGQTGRWPHGHAGACKHHHTPVSEGVQYWFREVNASDFQLSVLSRRLV